jgi:L-lactate dehydrogenase complex protein LldF
MTLKAFHSRIRQSISDENLQLALDNNARRRTDGRLSAFASIPDYQQRRARAHAIKADVVANLDEYLQQFIAHVTENAIQVHHAADSAEALHIFLDIAHAHHAHLVAKSKSMVSEEINFNHALEAAGIRAVETDLGEYIVQLRGERPSHIITPAVHLRRGQVGQLFHEKLGIPYTEDIPTLTNTARRVLREIFLTADIGVSGVNFGVAETGTLCIVTNEGNGRMCTTVPPVHVALMGIERLVPTLDDLALFLSLLPRSATGQKLSAYTSLLHSPRRTGEIDGPVERHLVLVDNGRSCLRSSPLSESLFCIRCGACLNACPVFRETSGHAYLGRDGSLAPYPGPIGSVISPGLFGCENFGHLAQASSLCGACKEACPVDIDLPALLLRTRAGETPDKGQPGIGLPGLLKLGLRGFRLIASTPGLFTFIQTIGGLFSHLYSPRRSYMKFPAWTGWGYSKDFPRLAVRPFRSKWKKINQLVNPIPPVVVATQPAKVGTPVITQKLADQFAEELIALGGKVVRVKENELPGKLSEFLSARGVDRVVVDDVGAEFVPPALQVGLLDPQVRVGVTGALMGIADTGSLVLVGRPGHPLTASLLPEVHLAILKTTALVPSLTDALRRHEIREAAAAVIISGPSRTGDIEMTLTIGVHGPGELHVFLIDDSNTV